MPVRLFYTNNTFKLDNNFGIGITRNIDCYYIEGKLQFSSFYYARQVFDLRAYYRTASEPEVIAFSNNDALEFENNTAFTEMTNSYVRRKIAMINDSGVLDKYTAKHIKKIAKASGIDITVKNQKVVIPANKDEAMAILAFLDEEAYRGPFTNDLLIANSKRILKKA